MNRIEEDPSAELNQVLEMFSRHHAIETDQIKRAYHEAQEAHDGQIRKSGDAYITHPVAVAEIVASLGLDESTIIAALPTTPLKIQKRHLNASKKYSGMK